MRCSEYEESVKKSAGVDNACAININKMMYGKHLNLVTPNVAEVITLKHNRFQVTKMNSKEILESYLDRDLAEVLGEKGLQNIVASETDHRLSETETEILTALIQRRHNEVAMERIRKNVSLLVFKNVSQQTAVKNDSENDNAIEDFIARLEKIYSKLENKYLSLEKEKESEVDRLEQLVEDVSKNNLLVFNESDHLDAVTQEINKYNSTMLSKS